MKEGFRGLLKHTVSLFRLIPGVDGVISAILRREVGSFVKQLGTSGSEGDEKPETDRKTMSIPVQGERMHSSMPINGSIQYNRR